MKIAFIANTSWNIYNFRNGLVHHFLKKGDEVIVLTPKDEYTAKIEGWGIKWFDTPINGTGTNPIEDIGYFLKVKSILKKERPDIALSYTIKSNIYSSLAGKLTATRIICNVSGLGTVFLTSGFTGKVALQLYRIAFRSADFVFFQNSEDKQLFLSYVKLSDKKVGLLPGSGIDLSKFEQAPLPQNSTQSFIMISRIIIEKGVRDFVEAARHFRNDDSIKFTLVGKLDEDHSRSINQKELAEWVENGIVEYFEHSDNIQNLISNADVVVLPSYREGTPRTLLEGAAIGRPLLATDVPGCREVVIDGYNGFLFKARNPQSLIDKIKLFLALNKEEKKRMADNSRIHAEKTFDEKIVIDIYDTTIRRIIEPA